MKLKKRLMALAFLLAFILGVLLPVFADTYSGMVVDISIYSLVVKGGNDVKLFQIRPETRGAKDAHSQDEVSVVYHKDDSGALVADRITITKRYRNW